jgi:hypothetical protein
VQSNESVVDRTVLLACEDPFLCSYLSGGLRQLGMTVVTSPRSIQDVLDLARAEPVPPLACISVNLPGVTPSLNEQLGEHGIPYVLFGLPWTQTAWTTAALLWPFSAYQIAHDLQEVMRRTAIANAVAPWVEPPPTT